MPIFDDDNMNDFKALGSGFAFSGVNVDTLGAMEQTLVTLLVDKSTSVTDFVREIEACLKATLESCQKSPRVDNLLVRVGSFNHDFDELHGFRPLADCHIGNYDGILHPGGSTHLYEAAVNGVDAMATYGADLMSKDYTVNGLLVVITDGCDVGSKLGVNSVKDALKRARMAESLESIMTILIGIKFTEPEVSKALAQFKDDAGLDQYIEAKDASPKTLAKIAGFVSKSVSSQSQALGTGSASKTITF